MFVVALSPSKSHYYVLFIYHVKTIGQVSPNWPIFRNRDIVYCWHLKKFRKQLGSVM